MDDHGEVPPSISSFISRHTLKASRVRDLSSGNKQPLAVGRRPQPLTLLNSFSVFIPPGNKTGFEWVFKCTSDCFSKWTTHVTTGVGVPVARHSISKGLLIITVLCVITSAPSMKGGTRTEKKYFILSACMTAEQVSYVLVTYFFLPKNYRRVKKNQVFVIEL